MVVVGARPDPSALQGSSDKAARELASRFLKLTDEYGKLECDLGLDPGEQGDEGAYGFHAASAATVSPLVMSVRLRGNPATLAARLPTIAADVDAGSSVAEARPLGERIWQRDRWLVTPVAAFAGVSALVLFLSAMGLLALMSISVSRRTREIGVRVALGANPRHVLARILGHAMVLMGSGVTAALCCSSLRWEVDRPAGRPADDVVSVAAWIAVTSAVMLAAGLLACVEPARAQDQSHRRPQRRLNGRRRHRTRRPSDRRQSTDPLTRISSDSVTAE